MQPKASQRMSSTRMKTMFGRSAAWTGRAVSAAAATTMNLSINVGLTRLLSLEHTRLADALAFALGRGVAQLIPGLFGQPLEPLDYVGMQVGHVRRFANIGF